MAFMPENPMPLSETRCYRVMFGSGTAPTNMLVRIEFRTERGTARGPLLPEASVERVIRVKT